MAGLNRVARRVALSASLALVAAFAIAAPLKPAEANDDWRRQLELLPQARSAARACT